jgi:hypothetical protein
MRPAGGFSRNRMQTYRRFCFKNKELKYRLINTDLLQELFPNDSKYQGDFLPSWISWDSLIFSNQILTLRQNYMPTHIEVTP